MALLAESILVVDALGNPVRLLLTGGQVHDSTQASALLDGLMSVHMITDRGYASQSLHPTHPAKHSLNTTVGCTVSVT